jgi:hypothetical protein
MNALPFRRVSSAANGGQIDRHVGLLQYFVLDDRVTIFVAIASTAPARGSASTAPDLRMSMDLRFSACQTARFSEIVDQRVW